MYRKILTTLVLSFAVIGAKAQLSNSLNAFSPYTMYGIGSLEGSGNLASQAMGGIGVAYNSPYEFNYINPAGLGFISQKTAIFNFGLTNSNYYQSSQIASTSYNSVDLADLAFAIPLAKGVGFGLALTPVSSVGYNTMVEDDTDIIIEDIGKAIYTYYGDGGISQLQASVGAKIFGGLSVGATMHYYFGAIDRVYTSTIYNLLNSTSYRSVSNTESMNMSQVGFSFGLQYKLRVGDDDNLTIGLGYTPKSNGDMDREMLTTSNSETMFDTVAMNDATFRATMPEKISGGVYFSNNKLGIGFDYSRQDWRGSYEINQPMSLAVVNDYRFGVKFTPDKMSVRSFMARLTYKAGARYSTSYLAHNGQQLSDWSVTAGFEMPLKMRNYSAFNVGLEYGSRGARTVAVTENYFKVNLGVTIFAADDMWFYKRQFN